MSGGPLAATGAVAILGYALRLLRVRFVQIGMY